MFSVNTGTISSSFAAVVSHVSIINEISEVDAYLCVCVSETVRALHDAAVVSDDCFVAGLSSCQQDSGRKGHTYTLVYVADVHEPHSSDI